MTLRYDFGTGAEATALHFAWQRHRRAARIASDVTPPGLRFDVIPWYAGVV